MTAGFSRSTLAVVLAASLFGIAGCAMRTATTPQPLADAERAAIADTVRQLYRESPDARC